MRHLRTRNAEKGENYIRNGRLKQRTEQKKSVKSFVGECRNTIQVDGNDRRLLTYEEQQNADWLRIAGPATKKPSQEHKNPHGTRSENARTENIEECQRSSRKYIT